MTELVHRAALVATLESIVSAYRDNLSQAIADLDVSSELRALMRAEMYDILADAERSIARVATGADADDPNFTDKDRSDV